jgi:hypothetical protein
VEAALSPKFNDAVIRAGAEIGKKEARGFRKIALAQLKTAGDKAALASRYADAFGGLEHKAADKTAQRYLHTVKGEFEDRSR